MTDQPHGFRSRLPLVVAVLLVLLAAAARWWPVDPVVRGGGTLLVLMPRDDARRETMLTEFAQLLGQAVSLDLRLALAGDREEFQAGLDEALLVLCPDGPAIALPTGAWQPLATGRRRAPWNLRPRPVLVSRLEADTTSAPWRTAPRRTVFGDSLSLVCLAPVIAEAGTPLPSGVTWGDDPYDHGGVLVALANGAFDHAVVRQFDAEAALATGRLPAESWRMRRLGAPVPDIMVMVSRRLPTATRRELQLTLSVLGREMDGPSEGAAGLVAGLGLLGLDGFNFTPMLGTDVERARGRYGAGWPPSH